VIRVSLLRGGGDPHTLRVARMSSADALGQELYDAACGGDVSKVDALVKRGAPINWANPSNAGNNCVRKKSTQGVRNLSPSLTHPTMCVTDWSHTPLYCMS
jgi:hypothetical protein